MSDRILEEAEDLAGERIATIRTRRGDEVIINIDKAVIALADLVSDHANDQRFGWSHGEPYWRDEFTKVRKAAVVSFVQAPMPRGEPSP